MQVVVRQISGLGNQLFQYAAGRYYAKRYGATMRIITDLEHRAISHGYPRPFLLSNFDIPVPVETISFYDRLILSPKMPPKTLRKLLGVQSFIESASQRYKFLVDLPLKPNVETLYLFGYWQSYRLVEAIAQDLRTDLRFKHPATGKNLDMSRRIKQSSNPVSLHVRRGDYTLAAEGQIALPLSYYSQAIALYRERLIDPTFFVFSDDISYVRQNLPAGTRAVFVDHNDPFSAQEDLRLMSECHHHILANSSFSWWGAWLNPSNEKMVIAPKHWLLREDSYFSDLTPSDWTLLDSCRSHGQT